MKVLIAKKNHLLLIDKLNKKKLNYILLPAVLLIWGGVIYTAIDGFSSNDDNFIANQSLPKVEMEEVTNDTFTLLVNYRDPFLRRIYSATNANNLPKQNVKKVKKKIENIPTVNWSFIAYQGRIKNQETGKHVGMLSINGKDYLINEGESIEEVKLVQLLEDSIKVSYQKKYAFIKKN